MREKERKKERLVAATPTVLKLKFRKYRFIVSGVRNFENSKIPTGICRPNDRREFVRRENGLGKMAVRMINREIQEDLEDFIHFRGAELPGLTRLVCDERRSPAEISR